MSRCLRSPYFLCDLEATAELADLIEDEDRLSFEDRLTHCLAPVDADSAALRSWFRHYAHAYALASSPLRRSGREAPGSVSAGLAGKLRPARTQAQLQALEERFAVLDLYLWLGLRFPSHYRTQDLQQVDSVILSHY